MSAYSYVNGGTRERGLEALILLDGQIVGQASMAVAPRIVQALNRQEITVADRTDELVEIVREFHRMLVQRCRPAPGERPVDDFVRAGQLLHRAGELVGPASAEALEIDGRRYVARACIRPGGCVGCVAEGDEPLCERIYNRRNCHETLERRAVIWEAE